MSIAVSAIDFVAHPELLRDALDLMVESFRQAYSQPEIRSSLNIDDLDKFLAELKRHEIEVANERPDEINVLRATCDGEPAGVVILDRGQEGVLYIRQIATSPRFRRRGVGSELVLRAIAGRDGREVCLVTRRINAASQAMFQSIGFAIDEQWSQPDYNPAVYLSMGLTSLHP